MTGTGPIERTVRNQNCYITGFASIIGGRVVIDDQCRFVNKDTVDFASFIKTVYKYFRINFPKFYKMDNLSRLAFMTAELLLKDAGMEKRYGNEEMGIVLLNSSSTLETDDKYSATISNRENYFPSPAVFVYTLPNIMIGEIAIRHRMMGENIALIEKEYNPGLLHLYTRILFDSGAVNACISGWVELDRPGERYESVIYLVEKDDNQQRNIKFEASYLEKHYCDLKAIDHG